MKNTTNHFGEVCSEALDYSSTLATGPSSVRSVISMTCQTVLSRKMHLYNFIAVFHRLTNRIFVDCDTTFTISNAGCAQSESTATDSLSPNERRDAGMSQKLIFFGRQYLPGAQCSSTIQKLQASTVVPVH